MNVNGTLTIGRLFGIQVRLHYLWLFAAGAGMLLSPALVPLLLVLFSVVFLHELGHCLVAKSFGIRVLDITLWPLGGLARMGQIPEDTRIESLIAIAGPAVNFGLAALALIVAPFVPAATQALSAFFLINMILGGFNLLPAFPMDGGRILRALLGRNGDWVRATEQAVRVSRICAYLMIGFGLFRLPHSFMLIIIGVWVLWVGTQELIAVRIRHGRSPIGGFAMPGMAAREREAYSWSEANNPKPTQRAYGESDDAGPSGDARRPDGEQVAGGFSGWTDDELERLEGFRGRLSEYRDD